MATKLPGKLYKEMDMLRAEVSEAISKVKPSKETIIVIGTGLSLALTKNLYPQLSWLGLIRHGYSYATENGLMDNAAQKKWLTMLDGVCSVDETLSVAGFLSKKLSGPGHVNYTRWFHNAFHDVLIKDEKLKNIIKNISDSGVRFCTLNYDSLLEQATGLPSISISDTDNVVAWIKGEKKAILHLHGYWEKAESCVLSDADYEKILGSKPRDFFQQNLMVLQTLLFVGCGGTFDDPNFQNILNWLNTEFKSGRVPNFALVSSGEIAERKKEWYGLVQALEYGEDRAYLPSFLEELFGEVTATSASIDSDVLGKPPMRLMEQGVKRVNLDAIRIALAPAPQANGIRHAQFYQASQIIESHRPLWIAADWGMREDEFIWSLVSQESENISNIYEINVSNYTNIEAFGRQVEDIFGESFESFCNALSIAGASYLILKDIPFDATQNKEGLYLDLQRLSEILTSFCQDLRVLLVSRQSPPIKTEAVELLALGAADTRTYIEGHPLYQGGLGREDLHQLFEYSNGVPDIIALALEKLAVASLDEIIVERGASHINLTGRFGVSITSLANSKDIQKEYAYSLLKHLSAFPYGEYLDNIKRVNRTKKFTIDHVVILQKEGFIYIEEQDRFGQTGSRASKKRLVVTRAVRQWIQQEVKGRELAKIKSLAHKLYFGENWETNDPKFHAAFKANDIGEQSSEINNAKSFIVELFAQTAGDDRKRSVVMGLASQFCAMITKKSYYKAVQDLFGSLRPWFHPNTQSSEYWHLSFLYGKALRMSDAEGASDEALDILLECLEHLTDSKTCASINLSIALIYSKRKDHGQAIAHAEKVQKLNRKGDSVQAAHVLLINKQAPGLAQELLKLENKAKKAKASAPYTNIALDRVQPLANDTHKIEELERIVEHCNINQAVYSRARALIELADTLLKVNKRLEPKMISELIGIYHHLHNDNLTNLHDKCHRLLWTVFGQNNDILNLLQLFKYSSLFWRLRDNPATELAAIQSLRKLEHSSSLAGSERDPALSYYHGRARTLLI